MKTRYVPVSFILLFLLFTGIGPRRGVASGQTKAQEPLRYEVAVFFKLVQAYVVDKKGNPVTDLSAADFELTDNGKARIIEHFEKIQLDLPSVSPPEKDAFAREAPPLSPPAPGLTRKFFFFFNYAFIEPGGFVKARKAALDFLNHYVHPTDEVGLITFSATQGLKVNEFLTTDHKRIISLIEGLGTGGYLGRAEQMATFFSSNVSQFYPDEIPGEKNFEAVKERVGEMNAAQATSRLADYTQTANNFLGAMRELARGLRNIPGYKNILLFSSGIASAVLFGAPTTNTNIPENPKIADMIKWQEALAVKDGDSRLRETYQSLIDDLKAANCPVFSFNVAGAQLPTDVASTLPPDWNGTNQGQNILGMKPGDTYGKESLLTMSNGTGGQYFDNSMNLEAAVQQLSRTTNTYYVLGFPVSSSWDGKFHKIKINVKRKGVSVYGEGGYYNPKPFAQYSEFEKLLHVLDLAEGRTLLFQESLDFSFAAFPVPVRGKTVISFFAGLPAETINALAGAKAEIVTILYDAKNRVAFFKRNPLFLAKTGGDTIFYDQSQGVSAGTYDCRTVIWDRETGRGAGAGTTLVVPNPPDSPGIRLYPGLLFKPAAPPRYQGNVSAWATTYPFILSDRSQLMGSLPSDTEKLTSILPIGLMGIQEPDIQVSGSIVNAGTGQSFPLQIVIKNSYLGPAYQILLIEFGLPPLSSGPYSLIFDAWEKNSGAKSQATVNILVKPH